MSYKLFNHRLASTIIILKRPVTIKSDFDLVTQMKLLNDQKQFKRTLELFDKHKDNKMKTCSDFMINQVIKACTNIGDLQRGLNIHHMISSRTKKNPYILASLIHLYMQCGDVTSAESLFHLSKNKTLAMNGAMMKGYIKNNMPNKAIDLFNAIENPDDVIIVLLFNACAQIQSNELIDLIKKVSSQIPEFYSNHRVAAALLDALIKCEDYSTAEIVFSKMKKCVIGYGNLTNGFNKENNPMKTLDLFNQMKIDGIEPNIIIYKCLIKALSKMGVFSISETIAEQIPNSFLFDNKIQTALMDMWGKLGYVNKAKEIFEKMSQPDKIAYTTMINVYGLNGMGIEAIELFRQMPSQFIHEVTYICILNGCSHSGLVNEARSIFNNIQIKTEFIYTTMIDCLGRVSLFEEAQKLIDEFERDHSPSCLMYMALLSGVRIEYNSHLSQQIFDRMKKLFPDLNNSLTSAATLLANVYSSSGDIEKASDIKMQLHKSGGKKKTGLSWTAVNGKVFQFRAHDQSHPRSDEIYAELDKISKELIEHGHQYDPSWITRPLNQEETVESVLCGHSEKLAIAWNFVENPNISRIHISKNLRVCGDCHRATKLIAAIRQCEIIVRDANRIHHFYTNGQCSCNDHF